MVPTQARIARRLASDVSSSKREIVIGLAIGIALSAVIGFVGQSYLHERGLWPAAAIKGSTHPGAAAPANAPGTSQVASVTVIEPLQPAATAQPLASAPAQEPEPRRALASEQGRTASSNAAFSNAAFSKALSARPSTGRAKAQARPRPSPSRRAGNKRGKASSEAKRLGPKSSKARLSPSQRAGLGMDLPL
jgi:hypothetical protein